MNKLNGLELLRTELLATRVDMLATQEDVRAFARSLTRWIVGLNIVMVIVIICALF